MFPLRCHYCCGDLAFEHEWLVAFTPAALRCWGYSEEWYPVDNGEDRDP